MLSVWRTYLYAAMRGNVGCPKRPNTVGSVPLSDFHR